MLLTAPGIKAQDNSLVLDEARTFNAVLCTNKAHLRSPDWHVVGLRAVVHGISTRFQASPPDSSDESMFAVTMLYSEVLLDVDSPLLSSLLSSIPSHDSLESCLSSIYPPIVIMAFVSVTMNLEDADPVAADISAPLIDRMKVDESASTAGSGRTPKISTKRTPSAEPEERFNPANSNVICRVPGCGRQVQVISPDRICHVCSSTKRKRRIIRDIVAGVENISLSSAEPPSSAGQRPAIVPEATTCSKCRVRQLSSPLLTCEICYRDAYEFR